MATINLPTPNLNTQDTEALARYMKQVVDKINEHFALKEVEDIKKDEKIQELESEINRLKDQIRQITRR